MLAALRHRDRVAADLARVLACWLVLVLLVQAQAALLTLVRGPAHRHAPVPLAQGPQIAPVMAPEFAHGAAHVSHHQALHEAAHQAAHQAAHSRGEPHHHAGNEVVLPSDGEAALDTAAFVLMGALVALAVHYAWPMCAQRAAPASGVGWALLERDPAPPRRPPRV